MCRFSVGEFHYLSFISAWCGSPWSSKTEADIPISTYSTKQIINFISCCYLFPRLHWRSNVNTSALWFYEWLGILVVVKDFISKNSILKSVQICLFVIHFSVTEGENNIHSRARTHARTHTHTHTHTHTPTHTHKTHNTQNRNWSVCCRN